MVAGRVQQRRRHKHSLSHSHTLSVSAATCAQVTASYAHVYSRLQQLTDRQSEAVVTSGNFAGDLGQSCDIWRRRDLSLILRVSLRPLVLCNVSRQNRGVDERAVRMDLTFTG